MSFITIGFAFLIIVLFTVFVRRGMRWGAAPEEVTMRMTGDTYLKNGPSARTAMTRAVSIDAPPETVWLWLAQLGRGAGWYSVDWLDNGGKTSARHIVTWIPAPELGDATAIGYLRHIEPGRELTWWTDGVRFFGARARLVTDILLRPEGGGSRLVIRMSADTTGFTARLAIWAFQIIDTIMGKRQILGIKQRVERFGARTSDPERAETGERDQFQLYEIIYASGERAGVPGKESAERWRQAAAKDLFIHESADI